MDIFLVQSLLHTHIIRNVQKNKHMFINKERNKTYEPELL